MQSARTTKLRVGRPAAAFWCLLLAAACLPPPFACVEILLRKRTLSNECSEDAAASVRKTAWKAYALNEGELPA